jgi:hypothetical protein
MENGKCPAASLYLESDLTFPTSHRNVVFLHQK